LATSTSFGISGFSGEIARWTSVKKCEAASRDVPMQQSIIIDAPPPVFHVLPPDEGPSRNGLIAFSNRGFCY
jgi:hypothetical protein